MADYRAWQGLGEGLSGGVDAYKQAKAAKAAAMRQQQADAQAVERQGVMDTRYADEQATKKQFHADDMAMEGRKLDAMGRAKKAADLKKLPTTGINAQDLANFPTDLQSLKDLGGSIQKNSSVIGPVAGPLNKMGSFLPEFMQPASVGQFKQVQSDIDNVKQVIGKIKEGGVLRAEDEKKYERILASIKDDPASAQYKIKQISDEMANKYNSTIDLLGAQGYETAGLNKQEGSSSVQAGTVEDGYKFMGGDPADPASWQKVQ